MDNKNFENFKQKANQRFNNKFDYSKANYINAHTKICIICPKHGEFWQLPMDHIKLEYGCPLCAKENQINSRKDTTETFIQKCLEKYGNAYDYSKVSYVKSSIPVIIIKNGKEYSITPNQFLRYGISDKRKRQRTLTTEDFIKSSKEVHGDKYDYSKSIYIDSKTHVTIICPIHGEFKQTPSQHLNGHGCSLCGHQVTIQYTKSNNKAFIAKATQVHANKYNYDKVEYINNHTKVIVTCPRHGDFLVTPANHLKGRGCPKCKESRGEIEISKYLDQLNITYQSQYEIQLLSKGKLTNKAILDFYLEWNNNKYAIEFHGIQHYEWTPIFQTKEEFQLQLRRDEEVRKYCKTNNIQLIEIKYDTDVIESLDLYFKNVAELKNLK